MRVRASVEWQSRETRETRARAFRSRTKKKERLFIVYNDPHWQEATSRLFTNVAEDLNSGQPRTTRASQGLERDMKPATPADCKSDALTNRQRCLLKQQ